MVVWWDNGVMVWSSDSMVNGMIVWWFDSLWKTAACAVGCGGSGCDQYARMLMSFSSKLGAANVAPRLPGGTGPGAAQIQIQMKIQTQRQIQAQVSQLVRCWISRIVLTLCVPGGSGFLPRVGNLTNQVHQQVPTYWRSLGLQRRPQFLQKQSI